MEHNCIDNYYYQKINGTINRFIIVHDPFEETHPFIDNINMSIAPIIHILESKPMYYFNHDEKRILHDFESDPELYCIIASAIIFCRYICNRPIDINKREIMNSKQNKISIFFDILKSMIYNQYSTNSIIFLIQYLHNKFHFGPKKMLINNIY